MWLGRSSALVGHFGNWLRELCQFLDKYFPADYHVEQEVQQAFLKLAGDLRCLANGVIAATGYLGFFDEFPI